MDQAQSVLTISGSFSGFAIQQQGPGSLSTHYVGSIQAEISGSTILFPGGSSIAGLNSGSWQPAPGGGAGSAPANYGGQVVNLLVDGKAAVRNAHFDLTSDALPITSESFSSQGLYFTFSPTDLTILDYNYSVTFGGSGNGSQPMTGTSTNMVSTNSTLKSVGTELVLTIPVDISGTATAQNPDDVQYRLRGQLVAKAPVSVTLQITDFRKAPGQLNFTVATTPGQSFTIEGSTNLTDWPTVVDQFTATNNPTVRSVAPPPGSPPHFFRVRRD